jgi:hypothetical protein
MQSVVHEAPVSNMQQNGSTEEERLKNYTAKNLTAKQGTSYKDGAKIHVSLLIRTGCVPANRSVYQKHVK